MVTEHEDTTDLLANRIRQLLEENDIAELRRLLQDAHPADIADAVDILDEDDRLRVFTLLDDETAGEVLDETEPEATSSLLKDLDSERAADILDEMPSDDAAEILAELPKKQADELIGLMEADEAADVQELLQYPEDSAGRLMTDEFISVGTEMAACDVLEMLRQTAPRAETVYYLYATDPSGELVGVLSLRDLVVATPETKVRDMMNTKVVKISAETDREEVARVVAKYDFLAVPVVDEQERLVGIITVDDIIDVIEEEASRDIYALAGTSEDPEAIRTAVPSVVRRLPWLLITVVGEIFLARVISGYELTLQQVLAVVFFIPVIMATGGNVGTQSLATMVRSIALGEQLNKTVWQAISREAIIGFLLGVPIGVFAGGIALLWQHNIVLGVVILISMTLTLTLSAVLGALIPLIFKWLGKDPAYASGPFITTLNDITSITIYFMLASQLLHLM